MPRKRRTPKPPAGPGQANRTDLLVPKPQAVRVPTGGGYGQAQALAQAQQAAPLDDAQARFDAAITAARRAPGASGGLTAPTTRPDEPVTAGLPIGAGPGPEVLPRFASGGIEDLPTLEVYRLLHSLWPAAGLGTLIEELEAGG